jgi:large subunit ribosomal protein L16
MVAPKKTKFRTSYVRNVEGVASRGTTIQNGDLGLISLESKFLSPNQIEAARRVISHATKRAGKVWIRIFPDQPMTAKPANVRMGSGKGPIKEYVAHVKAGRVMFEISGISKELAIDALTRAAKKLPVATKIIEK